MYKSIKDRLFENRVIDPITNCWLWIGATDSNNRGQLFICGRLEMVSRTSYELFKGPLKNWALHIRECLNPNCFNPDHLYDGIQSENRIDAIIINNENGFGNALNQRNKTHCIRGHEFTLENTKSYKGGRDCIECSRIRTNNRRNKLRNQTTA